MKRELKFRLWNNVEYDVSKSKMFYDIENVMECLKQQLIYNSGVGIGIGYNHTQHGSVFMQFTGLFDRNQKYIYENDVVVWFKKNDIKITGIIKWEQQACAFWLKWFDSENKSRYIELQATSGGDFYQNDYIEVIGNIYENPELLK